VEWVRFYVCACCSHASCSLVPAPRMTSSCVVCCHYPPGLSHPRSVNIYVLPALVLALNATLSSSASAAGPPTWQHGNIIVKGSEQNLQTFSRDWPSGCLAFVDFRSCTFPSCGHSIYLYSSKLLTYVSLSWLPIFPYVSAVSWFHGVFRSDRRGICIVYTLANLAGSLYEQH